MKRLSFFSIFVVISLYYVNLSFGQATANLADLTVSFKGPTTAAQGEIITDKIKISVKNKGGLVARNFHVDIILKESETVEYMCGRGYIASLRPGQAISSASAMALPVSIPRDIRPGNYGICAIADSTGVVAESNEGNNRVCQRITITERVLRIDVPPKIPKDAMK